MSTQFSCPMLQRWPLLGFSPKNPSLSPQRGGTATGCTSPHALLQAVCGEQRGEGRLPKGRTDTCSCLPFFFFFFSFYGSRQCALSRIISYFLTGLL